MVPPAAGSRFSERMGKRASAAIACASTSASYSRFAANAVAVLQADIDTLPPPRARPVLRVIECTGMLLRAPPEKHRGSPEVPVIPRRSRYFLFARARVSKRTAPAGTARLAENPPAYSVSEREADEQTDCNFQHSDKRAWAVTRTPPERIKRLKGGVPRDPRRVPA